RWRLSRHEPRRRDRLMFGGVDQVKDECRDARGISLVETVLQDLRYGLRTFRRAPAFSITAIATLAISTRALTNTFTGANTLFYRQLPVERPGELVIVSSTRGAAFSE